MSLSIGKVTLSGQELILQMEQYQHGGIALLLFSETEGPYCNVTVNLAPYGAASSGSDCVYIDAGGPPELIGIFTDNGWGELTGITAKSGYNTYQEIRLTDKFSELSAQALRENLTNE